MGNYGIKIAKATKNISSSTPSDYHFWSKYRAKSIKYQGSLNVTTNGGTDPDAATNSYTHNFGYIPQFMVFVTSGITSKYINCDWSLTTNYGKSGDNQEEYLNAYATSSQIVVSALWDYYTPQSGTSTGIEHTYTFDILLFMEEVETS
jgi:hypothetical protein